MSYNNSRFLLIIIIGFLFYHFIFNKNNPNNTKSNKNLSKSQSQTDRDNIKNLIEKQEKMLKQLQSKIDKKLNETKKIESINSIENMEVPTLSSNVVSSYPQHPANPNFNPYPVPPMDHYRNNNFGVDPMYVRDNQVLNDRLYPPLGRTERPTADLLLNFINNRPDLFNVYTRGPPDTFRPIGYLTRKDGTGQDMDSTLILFGRAKYPNSDLGEFYVTSSNKLSDVKIPLLPTNSNVRKITDVPNDVEIKGPILPGLYSYFELPKPDFTVPYM